MEIEIAEHGRMTESGSSLLRLIQNQDIPLLDLLVRESVQNSLDAAIKGVPSVNVDFVTGQFDSSGLNSHFAKISGKLDREFPSGYGKYDFIQIRDSGTEGLTGPVSYDGVKNNDFGNLLKLVYEICKPQQNEGAGGSWGLGKTVYFRIGIGLVIYYSRIFQNGKYISRMAACMVEDETQKNTFIPVTGNLKRGIAWWGQSDGGNGTVPLEDCAEIDEILNIFGTVPYKGNQTGTTIIIPYINSKQLLDEVYARNEEGDFRPYWTRSVPEYLNVAIQRWYAPRIMNRDYKFGAFLVPSVNHRQVKDMLPLFRVVRNLYIMAVTGKDTYFSENGIQVKTEHIFTRNVLTEGSAGTLVSVRMTGQQLKMLPPDNCKSPYQQISNRNVRMDGGNSPVLMYTRQPGMIVGYDYEGVWTHSMPRSSADSYIIGIFVLNSENSLKTENRGKKISLEEYIRQGEKADHAAWTDHNIDGNNPNIVYRIQRSIIKKITSIYREKNIDTSEKKNIGLSHALADILLPAEDFGKAASDTRKKANSGNTGEHRRTVRKTEFNITSEPEWTDGNITYEYEITLKQKSCILSIEVITDFKRYNAELWEKNDEVGKKFPLCFHDFSILASRIKKTDTPNQHTLSLNGMMSDNLYTIEKITSGKYHTAGCLKIICQEEFTTFTGKLTIHSDEPCFKVAFNIKEC